MEKSAFQPLPILPGWMSAHVETVGSTNAELAQLFTRHGQGMDRHWLTAGQQTLGRGRRARNWVSPPGNLYASLCLDVSAIGDDSLAVLPLAIGVAIQDCVNALVSSPVRLKWPNDVLIDGAKCCGLLMERQTHAVSGAVGLIIGIGLNVASHPDNTPYPATHLTRHGFSGDIATVFDNLATSINEALYDWQVQGFVAKVRQQWMANAKGIGEPIAVHLANETSRGIFEQLDEQGRLQLRLANGAIRTITAGDVFFN